jgi:hypothetical protein
MARKTGLSGRIGPRLPVEMDRSSVGKNEPIPHQENPALPRRHFAVIFADETRALRDEQQRAGRAVIDILRDLRRDLTRKVGMNRRDQGSGDDASGLQYARRAGFPDSFRTLRCPVSVPSKKGAARFRGRPRRRRSLIRSSLRESRKGRHGCGGGASAAEKKPAPAGGLAFLLGAPLREFGGAGLFP